MSSAYSCNKIQWNIEDYEQYEHKILEPFWKVKMYP